MHVHSLAQPLALLPSSRQRRRFREVVSPEWWNTGAHLNTNHSRQPGPAETWEPGSPVSKVQAYSCKLWGYDSALLKQNLTNTWVNRLGPITHLYQILSLISYLFLILCLLKEAHSETFEVPLCTLPQSCPFLETTTLLQSVLSYLCLFKHSLYIYISINTTYL